jgi:hypothetical protein
MGPWWAAVVFAASLPLGLGLNAATNLFPFGELFSFAGFGFYLGLGFFALSLIRLGVAARRQPRQRKVERLFRRSRGELQKKGSANRFANALQGTAGHERTRGGG